MKTLTRFRLGVLLALAALILSPTLDNVGWLPVLAQEAVDPKTASLKVTDLRPGFTVNTDPEKTSYGERTGGILVDEVDFVRDRTPQNLNSGPIEIKSLVARTSGTQQAIEQLRLSRQALTSASPPWTETPVAKLGDESVGLSLRGQSTDGPAVAHLFLYRKNAMVVGITVAGLEKATQMAEAEALAATTLKRIDPTVATQRAPTVSRPLNPRPGTAGASTTAAPRGQAATPTPTGTTSGTRVRVANTDNQGLNLRSSPSTSATVQRVLPEGTVLEVIGQDRQAEGRTWRNVRVPNSGTTGWVAGEYVVSAGGAPSAAAPAASPSPTATATPTPTPRTSATDPSAAAAASPVPDRRAAPGATPTPTMSTTGVAGPGAAAPSASPSAIGGPSVTTGTAETLDVAVTPRLAELPTGSSQIVDITVTRAGQPVQNADVRIEVLSGGAFENPTAPATDAQGKTTATWTVRGPTGPVGIGVIATAPDGVTIGGGSASFRVTE